jgi:hypothetical protein
MDDFNAIRLLKLVRERGLTATKRFFVAFDHAIRLATLSRFAIHGHRQSDTRKREGVHFRRAVLHTTPDARLQQLGICLRRGDRHSSRLQSMNFNETRFRKHSCRSPFPYRSPSTSAPRCERVMAVRH